MSRTFILIFAAFLSNGVANSQEKKYSFSETKMGSPFNIILVTGDSLKASFLAKQCYALVDSFNHVFSDYDSTSELNRLNASSGNNFFKPSAALWDIILLSQQAYQKSKGAFDITIGPLSRFWRKARKEKIFPDNNAVLEKRKLTGFNRLQIDARARTLYLPIKGMRLDLGGIAKGYIAQQVVDFLSRQGINQALADAGGDMAMSKSPPNSKGWIIGINIPETTDQLLAHKLLLASIAVATSGDVYQYFEHNGKKYSHIIDPRTGYGITSQRNVTVIAKNGTDADWLATACSILPVVSAKKLAEANHAELLITELKDGKIIYYTTKNFVHYWKQ